MTRLLLVAILCLIVAAFFAPALLDDTEPPTLGHGQRAKAAAPFVAAPSPAEHRFDLGPRFLELVNATKPKPRPRARTAPRTSVTAASVEAAGAVNGHPCGGDLPPCRVLRCESGGDPTAENPHSTASGLWQILDGTWNRFKGYLRAKFAPIEVQNEKAALIWDHGRGRSAWASCL